ncbi:RICIN domain-containing protein [Streptomyces sp. L7]
MTATALAATALALTGAPAQATPTSSTTLIVNAAQNLRSVTHVGTGSLYGVATASTPTDSVVQALKPNTFVQMAPGGSQLPNGEPAPAGDALVVAPKAAAAGAKVVVRMPDWYPNFPYQWVSWSNWLSAVDQQVAAVKASGATNISAYELWNEPDWTWDTTNAGAFDAGWARTYKEVRAKDANTPIQGPSCSVWNQSWMTTFLTDAKAGGTVPDVIATGTNSRARSGIAAHVAAYRSLESSLGISPRPIAIEEYGAPTEMGNSGTHGRLRRQVRARGRPRRRAGLLEPLRHPRRHPDRHRRLAQRVVLDLQVVRRHVRDHAHHHTTRPDRHRRSRPPQRRGQSGQRHRRRLHGLRRHGQRALVPARPTAAPSTSSWSTAPTRGRDRRLPGPGHHLRHGLLGLERLDHRAGRDERRRQATTSRSPRAARPHRWRALPDHEQEQRPRPGHPQRGHRTRRWSVVQATSTTGTDQNWTLVPAGRGLYKIVNQKSGLLLGITNAGTSNGGTALIWGDNGTADHLWQIIPARDGYAKIASYNSGLLLGVDQMSTTSGAQVLQWSDNGTADHLWKLTSRWRRSPRVPRRFSCMPRRARG